MKTAYDLLDIRPDADDETIKTAFREAAKLHHPDRRPGDQHAAFRFRQIATANAILRDPERRADYDRWLALERRHMRWERTHAIASRAIDVALFGAVLLMGSVWIGPGPTSEQAARLDREAARGLVEVVASDPPGSDGASAEPGNLAAPPTVAAAAAIATLGSLPDGRPNDAGSPREPEPAASEGVQGEVVVTNAGSRLAMAAAGGEFAMAAQTGQALRDIADPDHALAVYDAAIRIIPDNPLLFHDRGLMWRRKGDLDKALADMDRAIRFGFSDANFYNDRGLIWLEKGRYKRAIADFDRASQIDPGLADASINRDIALRRASEVARGPTDLDR